MASLSYVEFFSLRNFGLVRASGGQLLTGLLERNNQLCLARLFPKEYPGYAALEVDLETSFLSWIFIPCQMYS
jgi:hypothetical protein